MAIEPIIGFAEETQGIVYRLVSLGFELVENSISSTADSGGERNFRSREFGKDLLSVSISPGPPLFPDFRVVVSIAIAREATDRRRAEAAFLLSHFSLLSIGGVYATRPPGLMLAVSPGPSQRILGTSSTRVATFQSGECESEVYYGRSACGKSRTYFIRLGKPFTRNDFCGIMIEAPTSNGLLEVLRDLRCSEPELLLKVL